MNNTSFSFPAQGITEYSSQLILTYSHLSIEAKLSILTILITLLLAIMSASFSLYKEYRKRQKELGLIFNITWKNSTSVNKDEIETLDRRPFNDYYYSRDEDKKVRDCLEKEKSVLIVLTFGRSTFNF